MGFVVFLVIVGVILVGLIFLGIVLAAADIIFGSNDDDKNLH